MLITSPREHRHVPMCVSRRHFSEQQIRIGMQRSYGVCFCSEWSSDVIIVESPPRVSFENCGDVMPSIGVHPRRAQCASQTHTAVANNYRYTQGLGWCTELKSTNSNCDRVRESHSDFVQLVVEVQSVKTQHWCINRAWVVEGTVPPHLSQFTSGIC